MKFNFIIYLFFVCGLKTYSFNKVVTIDSVNVTIACLGADDKKISTIKSILQNDSTIKYVAYCSNHSVFLIKFFGTQQGANDLTEKIRKDINMNDKNFFIKEFKFGDIMSFCNSDNYVPDLKKGK